MTKIDDLWLYDQAQQAVAKIDNRLKTTPNRARLNKLHSFLTEQQAQAATLTKNIEARGAALTRLTSLCQDLERRLELELSEFSTMENDEECTAAEMTATPATTASYFGAVKTSLLVFEKDALPKNRKVLPIWKTSLTNGELKKTTSQDPDSSKALNLEIVIPFLTSAL